MSTSRAEQRHERVSELFEAAIALSEKDRTKFLRANCGDDDELLREVVDLVRRHTDLSGPLPPLDSSLYDAGSTKESIEAETAPRGSPPSVRKNWARVKHLYWDALKVPGDDRSAFLGRECGEDDQLRAAVEALLHEKPRLLGDFELLEVIGRGGMGVVYRAWQVSLEREVAVKVLAPNHTRSQRQVDRFQREARAIARLRHPGIVTVYAVGRSGDEHYFAMEFVPGHDLARELALLHDDPRIEGGRGPFLPAPDSREYITEVVRLLKDVGRAVDHAHEKGIVHRDIKPQNLLISSPLQLRVVDFGLARDAAQTSLSQDGVLAGTLPYMSPEQIEAKRASIDQRTDVYSLGVVLYEMLTQRRPFEGDSSQEILRHIASDPPRSPRKLNPRIPRDLETVCLKAMEKRREDRYATMGEFADDLERFLGHESIVAVRPPFVRRASRHIERHRWPYVTAVAALAALFVGVWWATARSASVLAKSRVEAVEGLLAEEDLDRLTIVELVESQRRATELLNGSGSSRGERGRAQEALERIETLARERKRIGRESLERGLDQGADAQSQVVPAPSDAAFYAGLQLLHETRALLPQDEKLAEWAQPKNHYPLLEVALPADLPSEDVSIYLYESDWVWDRFEEPRTLEGWRDGPVRVEQGLYRIVVVAAGYGYAELSRYLDTRGRTYTIEPMLRRSSEVLGDMIEIPAGEAVVGIEWQAPWLDEGTRFIEAFWIDAMEVTNAEYQVFVVATGHAPPVYWGGVYPEAKFDLPVIGVKYVDARAYAEWAGKRLPTWTEWEKAARGTEGWEFPWGSEGGTPDELQRRAVIGRPRAVGQDLWDSYVEHVRPVGSHPDDRSPYGLYDTLGNVKEWTDSPYPAYFRGEPVLQIGSRAIKGVRWDSLAQLHLLGPEEVSVNSTDVGFRCAKGAYTQ